MSNSGIEKTLRHGLGVTADDQSPKFLEAIAMQLGAPHHDNIPTAIARAAEDIVNALQSLEETIREAKEQ